MTKKVKAFALIFVDIREKIVCTSMRGNDIGMCSIFYTRKDAKVRQKEIMKAIKTKIVPCVINY